MKPKLKPTTLYTGLFQDVKYLSSLTPKNFIYLIFQGLHIFMSFKIDNNNLIILG